MPFNLPVIIVLDEILKKSCQMMYMESELQICNVHIGCFLNFVVVECCRWMFCNEFEVTWTFCEVALATLQTFPFCIHHHCPHHHRLHQYYYYHFCYHHYRYHYHHRYHCRISTKHHFFSSSSFDKLNFILLLLKMQSGMYCYYYHYCYCHCFYLLSTLFITFLTIISSCLHFNEYVQCSSTD